MALQLESLIFSVDSSTLEDAVKKIDNLSVAISNLKKAQQEEIKSAVQSEKLKQEEAKTAIATAKAKEAEAKVEETLTKAKKTSASASKESTEATDANNKILQRQKDILDFMNAGFSKGQSSVLSYAKASGALGSELKELESILSKQRSLMGASTFDDSLSGLIKLQTEYRELEVAMKEYANGTELTKKQTRDLAKDFQRISESMQNQGKSVQEIDAALAAHESNYVSLANQVNGYVKQEKELERQRRESANAVRFLVNEEERMVSVLGSMNNNTEANANASLRAANSIAKYERSLKLAGVGAAEATRKLALYKQQVLEVQKMEETRRAQYLSRALAPQISDVAVSLAGGMNPMTVLLQQGLQVRDLIGQSGVEASKLQAVFKTAAADMVGSIKGTAVAIGSLFIGSIVSAGDAIKNAFIAPINLAKASLTDMFNFIRSGNTDWAKTTSMLSNLEAAFTGMAKFGIAATVTGLAAFVVASVQVMTATSDMSNALVQFGARLGITFEEAKNLAAGMSDLGITYADALGVVGEFAKSGITDFDTLQGATAAAAKASKILGVEVSTLREKYTEIGKKPVETLIELNTQSGILDANTIRHIQNLIDQGKEQDAVNEAHKAYTQILNETGEAGYKNLSSIEKLWFDIKDAFNDAWGAIQRGVENIRIFDALRGVLALIRYTIQQALTGLTGISRLIASAFTGNFEATLDAVSKESLANTKEFKDTLLDIQGANDKTQEQLKAEAALRKKNAEESGKLAKEFKKNEEDRKKAAKEYEQHLKGVEKAIDDFQKMQVKASGTTEELSKAQTHLMNVMDSPVWAKSTAAEKERILVEFAKAHAAEEAANAFKEQEKALKNLLKLQQEMNEYFLEQDTKIAETTAELDFQYSLLGKSEKEIKSITRAYEEQKSINKINSDLQKQQLEYLQKYATEAGKLDGDELIRAQENAIETLTQMQMKADEQIGLARNESQLKSIQEYEKEWSNIKGDISSILYDSLSEGGKDAAKKIRQYIEDTLKKKFILPAIDLVVNLIGDTGRLLLGAGLNLLTGGSSGGGLGTALGLVNSASSLGTVGGAVASVWSGSGALPYTESLASAYGAAGGDTVGAFINMNPQWSAAGQSFGEAASASITKGTSAMTTSWANMANIAGAGLAAYGVGSYVGQKYGTVAGTAAGTLAGAGTYAAGSALATGTSFTSALAAIPGWGWVAAGVLALVGALGGKKPKLKGDVVGGEYSGDTFTVTSSERVGKRSLGGEEALTSISEIFSGTFAGLLNEFEQEANFTTEALFRTRTKAFGRFSMDGERLAGEHSKRYSLDKLFNDVMSEGLYNAIQGSALPDQIEALFDKSMDVEGMATAIAAVVNMNNTLQEAGTDLATFVGDMNFDSFRAEGERNIDVVSRMVATTLQMNTVFERLNLTLFDLTASGFSQIESLKEMLGGEEAASNILQGYYENFFTEEEKRINIINNIKKQLIAAGADIEKINIGEMTRLQYREFTEATIAAKGATDPLSVALLKLSSDFATLTESIDATAEAAIESRNALIRNLTSDVDKAYAALEKSIDAEKKKLSERFKVESDVLKDRIQVIATVIKTLDSAISSIEKTVTKVTKGSLSSARSSLEFVISSVKAGADIGKFTDTISEASTVLVGNDTKLYTTRTDYERDQRKSLNLLSNVSFLSKEQLTEAERQLRLLETWFTAEIRRLDQILERSKSQIDALLGINNSVQSLQDAINAINSSILALSAAMRNQVTAVNPSRPAIISSQTGYGYDYSPATINTSFEQQVNNLYSEILNRNAEQEGLNFWVNSGLSLSEIESGIRYAAETVGIPAYADGGYYPGGLALVGESGPELINFSNPGQVYTANQTASLLSSDNSELVEALLSEVRMLRAETRATAINTSKTARILDDTTQGGTELRVVTVA